jgi:hypothetical protein
MPENSSDSCLDPELPGTGLELRGRRREGEAESGPSRDGGGSWNPAEMRENMTRDYEKPI